MDDKVRHVVYDITMKEGVPPSAARVAEKAGESAANVLESFLRLADARMLVLQPNGEILMAGPFSAVPTPFAVTTSDFSAYGNCIWDALGIPAMLKSDAVIDTNCADCGEQAKIRVSNGAVAGSGFMHFVVPPRLWWMHIVYT
ncbi:MAG TPA: organomercurial lyase [Thermoanaerobaculia bacterium]